MLQKDHITYNLKKSERYPNHVLNINKWIAESKEILNYQKKFVDITKETEKAYLISFDIPVENEYWMPKSQCEIQKMMSGNIFEF